MEIISPEYHPAQAATYGGSLLRPLLNTPNYPEREHYSLTVQPFRAGGYEAVVRVVDLQKAADLAAMPRKFGKREDPGERSADSLNVSRQRAKGMVRKRIKDMGANRLCTLTVRQSDALGYMSPEEWARAFAKFVRLVRRAGYLDDYVAILEPHKKGLERLQSRHGGEADAPPHACSEAVWDIPLHIHFCTRSLWKMPVNLMRKCWAIAAGRDGNIDVQFLRVKHDSDDAIDKVAAYATKYITKGLAEFERFNKKRYWTAGQPLLEKGRYWLRSRNISDAFREMREKLGINGDMLGELISKRRAFIFPDCSGIWLNVRPMACATPPPF